MKSPATPATLAILFQLEPAVETELAASLQGASCAVARSAALPAMPGTTRSGVVFCSRGAAYAAAREAYPDLPVVVVSRLPDTHEWLEVLESGADDYIAAPFETVQLRWLLDAHQPPAHAAAPASTPDTQMPKCA